LSDEVRALGRTLRERHEHLWERFALQPLPPHIAHDAHDCVPGVLGIPRAQLEPSAHWIVPRPRSPSHCIVDDRDRRSIPPIPDREEAASEQRRPDGFKEIRADLVSCELQALGNDSVVSFDCDNLFLAVRNEQIADDAGVLHTRNRLNLF
jgi:hypothetical protein